MDEKEILRAIQVVKFQPYTVNYEDIRIIGQVIWFARELIPRE